MTLWRYTNLFIIIIIIIIIIKWAASAIMPEKNFFLTQTSNTVKTTKECRIPSAEWNSQEYYQLLFMIWVTAIASVILSKNVAVFYYFGLPSFFVQAQYSQNKQLIANISCVSDSSQMDITRIGQTSTSLVAGAHFVFIWPTTINLTSRMPQLCNSVK